MFGLVFLFVWFLVFGVFFLETPEFDQSINLDGNIFLLTSRDMAQSPHNACNAALKQ